MKTAPAFLAMLVCALLHGTRAMPRGRNAVWCWIKTSGPMQDMRDHTARLTDSLICGMEGYNRDWFVLTPNARSVPAASPRRVG